MEVSKLFVLKTLIIDLPGCPEEIQRMRVRSIALGDEFDSEIQLEPQETKTKYLFDEDDPNSMKIIEPPPPIYLGEIRGCFYSKSDNQLLLATSISSTVTESGDWIMTDINISPPPTVTDDEGITKVVGKQWLLNGIYINLANDTKKRGGKIIRFHPVYLPS